MKIKLDFVTNSSSTAFIVFWPHEIKRLEDVSNYIKKDIFADAIFDDAKDQKALIVTSSKTIMQKIINALNEGYILGDYETDEEDPIDFCKRHDITEQELYDNRIWYMQMWTEQELKRDQQYVSIASDLISKFEGKYAYFFEYGDEGSTLYYELETQNNWGEQPYVRISKH